MSSPRPPRSSGPLPAAVYWRRRLFVLGVAFSLVFVTARWLTASSDGSSDEAPSVRSAGAEVPATRTGTAVSETDAAGGASGSGTPTGSGVAAPATPTLAEPEGECSPSDVAVTPSVAEGAVAGRDVPLTLSLQTLAAEACTWQVGPDTLTVRVAEDGDEVWSTRECPNAVPSQAVVVRRAVATVVTITWSDARESTAGCSGRGDWVLAGTFTIAAAALGGEPAEAEFTLGAPAPETVLVTPQAPAEKKPKKPKTPVN